jgi:hypothetical protein
MRLAFQPDVELVGASLTSTPVKVDQARLVKQRN